MNESALIADKFSNEAPTKARKKDTTDWPLIFIDISNSETVIFYNRYLRYKGNRVNYKDIYGISYLLTHTTSIVGFCGS